MQSTVVTSTTDDTGLPKPSLPTDYPPLHIVTPLLKSRKLSDKVGCSVWLKLENVQTSGSFKSRGLGRLCQKVCVCVVVVVVVVFVCVFGGDSCHSTL